MARIGPGGNRRVGTGGSSGSSAEEEEEEEDVQDNASSGSSSSSSSDATSNVRPGRRRAVEQSKNEEGEKSGANGSANDSGSRSTSSDRSPSAPERRQMRNQSGSIGGGESSPDGGESADPGSQVTDRVDAGSTSPNASERTRIKNEGVQGPEVGVENAVDDVDTSQVENGVENQSNNDLAQDAQDLEQQVIQETDGITSGDDVRVVRDEDKLVAKVTEQGRASLEQRQAQELEQQFIEQNEAFDSRDEVQVTRQDGRLVAEPTARGESALEGWRRVEASQSVEAQLEERLQQDVTPGEDFEVDFEEVEGRSPSGADREQARRARELGESAAAREALRAERGIRADVELSNEIEQDLKRKQQVEVGGKSPSSTNRNQTLAERQFANKRSGPLAGRRQDNPASIDGQETVARGAVQRSVEGGKSFGKSAEPDNVIESRVPDEGDLLAGTSPAVRDFGRTVLGEEAPDTDVTDSLTEGDGSTPFTLTEDEQEQARKGAQNYREYFGVGEEAEQVTQDLTGSDKAATLAGGLGEGLGDLASTPRAAPLLVDTGVRTTVNLSDTVREKGALDTGEAIANTAFSSARGGVESFSDDPLRTTGRIAGGFVAGAAVTRGASAARTQVRSRRVKSRSDKEVDLEDITSEKGARGENPEFDTDPDAPTSEAVDELSRRAADNPKAAAPGDADSAVFHTTGSDISGSRGIRNRVKDAMDKATRGERTPDIDVGEGRSELPGLYTASDVSPLGLDMGTRSSIATSLGRPRLRGGKSDQVISLPGDDIRGMPDRAQGAGYELRRPDGSVKEQGLGRGQAKSRAEGADLEVRPDSSTEGYQFLKEDAEAGAIYARPSGSRTPELEGIAPPGSKFVEEGITAVNMPGRSVSLPGGRELGIPGTGRTIPMRRFERMDSDEAGGKSGADLDGDAGDVDAEAVTAYELPSSRSRSVTPGQQAAAGGYLGGGASAVSGGGKTDTSSDSNALNETTSPTDLDSSNGASGSRGRSGTGLGGGSSTGFGSGSGSSGSPTPGSGSPTGSGRSTGGTSSSPPTTGGSSSSPGGSSSGVPTSLIDTPTSPPTRPPLPELNSNKQKKRRKGEIESFERTFEFGVAEADEILDESLSVGAKSDVIDLTEN